MTLSDGVTLGCLLWYKDSKSDKIWGYLKTQEGTLFNFWGKRVTKTGDYATPQFKRHYDEWELAKLAEQKRSKGYTDIPESKLDQLVPILADNELLDTLTMARLSGEVRTDEM